MGLIPNEGQQYIMEVIQADLNTDSTLRLFTDDITPDLDTVLGGLTEADFSGYAAVGLAALWSAPALNGDDKWESTPGSQAFTHDGGGGSQTVYGYYVETGEATLITIKLFDSPVTVGNDGDEITVTVRLTLNEDV